MATGFGIFVRKRRIERGVTLGKMAESIGTTTAYLSAMEVGKRAVTKQFQEKIANYLSLSSSERAEIERLAYESQPSLKLDMTNLTNQGRNAVAAFARNLDNLTEDDFRDFTNFLEGKCQ